MYTTIVDPRSLHEHLNDPAWVVIDCRNDLTHPDAGERAYALGHIPGAFHASLEGVLTGAKTGRNGRHPLPEPENFMRFLRQAGVDDQTQLVVYDDGGDMYAARLWFMARWVGHDAAALLDGGYAAWTDAGYSVSREAATPRGTTTPGVLLVRRETTTEAGEILAALGTPHLLMLDARSPDRFAGQNESIDPVAGHIPGAHNRFFKENFDERGRMKPPEQLRAEFVAAGVAAPERVVHQCGSGISACVNLLAMEHAGLAGSRLYPGSWSEWISDPSRPVMRE